MKEAETARVASLIAGVLKDGSEDTKEAVRDEVRELTALFRLLSGRGLKHTLAPYLLLGVIAAAITY